MLTFIPAVNAALRTRSCGAALKCIHSPTPSVTREDQADLSFIVKNFPVSPQEVFETTKWCFLAFSLGIELSLNFLWLAPWIWLIIHLLWEESGGGEQHEKVVGHEQVKMETRNQKSRYEREDPELEMKRCKWRPRTREREGKSENLGLRERRWGQPAERRWQWWPRTN